MNGPLSCSAQSCVHNINGLCSANKIHVSGVSANTSSGTQCETFAEKGLVNSITHVFNMNVPGEIRQLFNKGDVYMSPVISCDALQCIYNSNRACTAGRVQVTGPEAGSSQETQCETFRN